MQNSQENIKSTMIFQQQNRSKLFQLLYIMNQKNPVQKQIYCALTAINSIIIILIYLSFRKIALFHPIILINNQIAVLIMFSVLGLIILQFFIAILYNRHIFIKIQFLVYRNIIYPLALSSVIVLDANQGVGVICTFVVLFLDRFVGGESYSRQLIVDEGLPITFYLLVFQIFLFLYEISGKYEKISLVFMIIASLSCRIGVINSYMRRSKCFQYTLFRIQSSLNLIYVAFLVFQDVSNLQINQKQPFIHIFPLISFIVCAEFFHEFSNTMPPISIQFFNSTNYVSQFLLSIQYITDDLDRMANNQSQDVTQTCLIPFYYEHIKNCKRIGCPLQHEIQGQILNPNGHFKGLCIGVFRIAQQLFNNIITVEHENVNIKLALLKFYIRAGPNKVKILQLVAQIQTFNLTWYQKLKLYLIKRFVSDIDVVQFLETMKTQDSYESFNYSISTLMRFLIEFWTQFLEDRVDFQKIIQISEKITPIINSIEGQIQNCIEIEIFSTIRMMRIYSDYVRWIMNDQMKSAMITDYTNLLSKKISEVHEINCITADVQIGLIAISLNVKKLGDIKIANSKAANIFNYIPQDFQKLSVNKIMPDIFAKFHDDYLKAFLSNQNKKVNNDRRLLLGKKKEGYLFQIYLQLQKSAITSSQEMIFIANIQLAKKSEATILITCDQKGEMSNINSTYQEFFYKSLKKNKNYDFKPYTNIQQLIPNFFDIVLDEKQEIKQTIQCYDNPLFGIIQIKYQISKITSKRCIDVGYIIKGHKIVNQRKEHFFKHLSLTDSLVELADDRDLKGMKIQYSPENNQYIFNDSLDVFGSGQFLSQFTIPYVKVQFLQNILNNTFKKKSSPQYDFEIKTIRYCTDHFERVQQMQSFESQISQEQKTTINNFKFTLQKQNIQKQQNQKYKNSLKIASIILLFVNIIWLSLFYILVDDEKKSNFFNTYQFVQAYDYRSKITQYILYFQIQNDPLYGQFFAQKRIKLLSELIDSINDADIPQQQKQRALKIVYLEETLKNSTFAQLINDDTIYLTMKQIPVIETKFTVFAGLFGVLIIVMLLFNFAVMQWHQHKIVSIFSLFLGLSQQDIKNSHKKCVQFLKDSSLSLNQQQEKLEFYEESNEQSDQQSSHTKIKRFKNILLGRSPSNFVRLNVFTLIFFIITTIMLLNNWIRTNHIKAQKSAYQFISTVMPEFSADLMKIYSNKKQNITLTVQQSFAAKYQTIDHKLTSYKEQDQQQALKLISIMFDNQCNAFQYDLPSNITCEKLCDGVMLDGVSKAINFLSHRMAKIQSKSNPSSQMRQLNQLSILLYYLIQPNILSIKQTFKARVQYQQSMYKIQTPLYFIILLCVAICNTIYQYHYPLDSICKSVIDSKLLINLIPQFKKKTKNGYTSV